jgi:hypothetical protein
MKVSEKLKKYDGIINNKRDVEFSPAFNNPLVRNKGYIEDDWLWERTLTMEQSSQKLKLFESRHHKVNSFHAN